MKYILHHILILCRKSTLLLENVVSQTCNINRTLAAVCHLILHLKLIYLIATS